LLSAAAVFYLLVLATRRRMGSQMKKTTRRVLPFECRVFAVGLTADRVTFADAVPRLDQAEAILVRPKGTSLALYNCKLVKIIGLHSACTALLTDRVRLDGGAAGMCSAPASRNKMGIIDPR
jgi:hypothetical protein